VRGCGLRQREDLPDDGADTPDRQRGQGQPLVLARPELDLLDAAQGDPAPGGLVRTDRGEAAARGPVRGEPAPGGDRLEGRGAQLAADPSKTTSGPAPPVMRVTCPGQSGSL
jgi:hypothetical protein